MIVQDHTIEEVIETQQYAYVLPHSKAKYLAKRSFDIVFSLLVIIAVFPWLFPLLFLLIFIDSKGSIFFVQERNGWNNKVFRCIKFRTMIPNKEANTRAAEEDDHRITRVGKILRITGIDELPQFINVLRGEMSIVGPRPHMLQDNLRFQGMAEHYNRRSLVRPGITGLAQIKGYKGNINDLESIKQRTIKDLEYVETYSLPLDLKIIGATAGHMFSELIRACLKPGFKMAKSR